MKSLLMILLAGTFLSACQIELPDWTLLIEDAPEVEGAAQENENELLDGREAQTYCLPKAQHPLQNQRLDLERLRLRLIGAASCDLEPSQTPDGINGEALFGATGTRTCTSTGCWQTLPRMAFAHSEEDKPMYGYSQGAEHFVVGADRRVHDDGRLHVKLRVLQLDRSALQYQEIIWDAEGNLLSFSNSRDQEGDEHSITLRYEEGRLVWSKSIEYQMSDERHFEWEDDRLVSLSIRREHQQNQSVEERQARFLYDATGRLVHIERLVDGQEVLTQSWSYDAVGELVRHSTDGVTSRWIFGDDHAPVSPSTHLDVDQRGLRDDDARRCTMLPRGRGYGFPASDRVYDLGLPQHQRPRGIEFLHEAPFAYLSFDLGWFGLNGVELSGFSSWPLRVLPMRVETTYQNGKMQSERYSLEDQEWTRRRIYDERNILVVETLGPVDGEGEVRELHFSYDENEQLIERRRLVDGTLTHQQKWQRQEHLPLQCNVVAYLSGSQSGRMIDNPQIAGLEEELAVHRKMEVTPSGDCLGFWYHLGGQDSQSIRRDAQGRLVYQSTLWSSTSHEYDVFGGLERMMTTGQYTRLIENRSDDEGRLLSFDWEDYGGNITGDDFEYRCEQP